MRTASQPRLEDAATVVREFNAAWNDHDLAAALALTSDDCVFEATSPSRPVPLSGVPEFVPKSGL